MNNKLVTRLDKSFNYENKQYLCRLDELSPVYYSKYLNRVQICLTHKLAKFLDVGCGNGRVLKMLRNRGYLNTYGVDISNLFVQELHKKKLKHIYTYNGVSMPFRNNFFDVVGSFNVLEHTKNPISFLKEQVRILRPGGYLIVACPNFLTAVLNHSHPRIAGFVRKIQNVLIVIRKLIKHDYTFEKMPIIHKDYFDYDDDAIVVTNLLDLKQAVISNGCIIIYESGFIQSNSLIHKIIDKLPIIKYIMPSCFLVARKN
jgi:SAM-dependent methyltransferase